MNLRPRLGVGSGRHRWSWSHHPCLYGTSTDRPATLAGCGAEAHRRRSHSASTGREPAPDDGLKEACGVFGVYAPGQPVAHLTYLGLYALQHRGQESAGMAVARRPVDHRRQGHGPRAQRLQRADARRRCRGTSPSATPATARPAPARGATPSPCSARPAASTVRPRPQRQPHQHRGAGRRRRGCCRGRSAATATSSPSCWPSTWSSTGTDLVGALAAVLPTLRGRVLARARRRGPDHRRPRPRRLPAAVPRPARRRLGAGVGDAGPRHRRRRARAGAGAGRDRGHRRRRPPHACRPFPPERIEPDAVPVRVRLLRPARRPALRPQRGRGPRPHGRAARRAGAAGARHRAARAAGDGDAGARERRPRRPGLRPGQRHPLRRRAGEEPLHRPHLHRAQPGAARPAACA